MLNEKYLNKAIDFAWADEISFDSIKEQTGLNEKQVIKLMRSNLKPRSFKHWRERAVSYTNLTLPTTTPV